MNISPLEYEVMLARVNANRRRPEYPSAATGAAEGEDRESGVRKQITAWCDAQWPKWVPMGARTDKPSTLPVGAQDLAIFGPFPTCILVDTKSKSGKPSPDQRIWAARLRALGWTVHFVKKMEVFLEIVKEQAK